MTATTRPTASSTSASVVNAPRLNRTDERSRSSGTPMAIRVGDGAVAPLAQAEPSEAETPARSRLHQEGVAIEAREAEVERLRQAGRFAGRAVADDPIGPDRRDQARFEPVAERSPATHSRRRPRRASAPAPRPGRRPAPPAASPASAPAAGRRRRAAGGVVTPLRTSSSPRPPGRGTCGRWRRAWRRPGHGNRPGCGRRPARRRCGRDTRVRQRRQPRRPAGSRRSRCWRASARRAVVSGLIASMNVSGSANPSASTPGRVTSKPDASSRAAGPATAGCSIGADDDVARRRPREAEDGEVVRLGPARGEDDLVGMGPEDPRRRSPRLLRRARAARRGRASGGSRGCRPRARTAASPRGPRGRAASSRCGRGRAGT